MPSRLAPPPPPASSALVTCVLFLGACGYDPPPLDERQEVLLEQLDQLAQCIASDVPLPTTQPEFRESGGPRVIPYNYSTNLRESLACIEDLSRRGRVIVSDEAHGELCAAGSQACIRDLDLDTCSEQIVFPDRSFPRDISSLENLAGDRATFGRVATTYAHESVHTTQTQFSQCRKRTPYGDLPCLEHEAYMLEFGFDTYLDSQMGTLTYNSPTPPYPRCRTIREARDRGLSPCVEDFIVNTVADGSLGIDDAIPSEACTTLHRSDGSAGVAWMQASTAISELSSIAFDVIVNGSAYTDEQIASATFPITETSEYGGRRYIYDEATAQLFLYERTSSGWSFVANTTLDIPDVRNLQILEDGEGNPFVVALGSDGAGTPALDILRLDADALFTGAIDTLLVPQVRDATALYRDATNRWLLWSQMSQRALTAYCDPPCASGGPPIAIGTEVALWVPEGLSVIDLAFSTDAPAAAGSLETATADGYSLHFNDDNADGVYHCGASAEARDIASIPSFGAPLVAGLHSVWIDGTGGHEYRLLEIAPGTPGVEIASGTFSDESERVQLSGALAPGYSYQVVDLTQDSESLPMPSTTSPEPTVASVVPTKMSLAGGHAYLRGSHLSAQSEVEVDGAPASFQMIGDDVMRVTVPARPSATSMGVAIDGRHVATVQLFPGAEAFVGSGLGAFTTSGTGWDCPTGLESPADHVGVDTGCSFVGDGSGQAGTLLSPAIAVPAGESVVVRLLHRMDFGLDGDGLVVMGTDQTRRLPLERVGRPTRPVHAPRCAQGACQPDADFAGLAGISLDVQPAGWTWDTFWAPPGLLQTGSFRVALGASDTGTAASSSYSVAAIIVQVGATYAAPLGDRYAWTDALRIAAGTGCEAPAVEGGPGSFECLSPGDAGYPEGASGGVLTWNGSDEASVEYDLAEVFDDSTRQARLTLRTRGHFSDGPSSDIGSGRVELCCGGNCNLVEPTPITCNEEDVANFAESAWHTLDGVIDDRDSEATWTEYSFGISSAVDGGCSLKLSGSGAVDVAEGGGWFIDRIVVEQR